MNNGMIVCHGGQCHLALFLIAVVSLNLFVIYWLVLRLQSVWGRDFMCLFLENVKLSGLAP